MALKKVFRVTLHVDPAMLHDIMLMGGKGVEVVDVQPVRHGGEDDSGELRSVPTGREFCMAFVASMKGAQFTAMQARAAAKERGMTRATVAQALVALTNEGILKRIENGVYQERATKASPKPKERKKHLNIGAKEGSMAWKVMRFIASKQNGSGDGISLADIKAGIGAKAKQNISPYLTDLITAKRLVRIAPSHYRTTEA